MHRDRPPLAPMSSRGPLPPAHPQDWFACGISYDTLGKGLERPGSRGSPLALSLVATISPPSILDFLAFHPRAPKVISPHPPRVYNCFGTKARVLCGIIFFLRSNSRHVKYPFHTTLVAPWRLTVWGKVPVRPRLEPLDIPPRGFLISLTVSTAWNYMVLWVFASSSLPTGLQSSWAELSWSCSGCAPSSGLRAWLTEILTSYLLSV